MSIIFYEEEKEYLKNLLKRQSSYWVVDNILKKLSEDSERLEKIKSCDHSYADYIGHRTSCVKCGQYKQDIGFEWVIADGSRTGRVSRPSKKANGKAIRPESTTSDRVISVSDTRLSEERNSEAKVSSPQSLNLLG